MYVTIGGVDYTDVISQSETPENVSGSNYIHIQGALSDPNTTNEFIVEDINQTISLQDFMEVIVWDENAPALNGIATVPAMNYALNPLLINTGGAEPSNWTVGGTLGSGVWSYPQEQAVITFANTTSGTALQQQTTLINKVVAGVEYMISVYMTGGGTISNIQALLQITFTDINGNTLGSVISQTYTPTSSEQHISLSGTAPANAVFAIMAFGGQPTVSGTNSGTITFSSVQFEPMWFADKGVNYPTPDCNFGQANSIILPDGTCSRACRIFTGYIEDLKNYYVGTQRYYDVNCAATSKMLETLGLINISYSNAYDTYIINDLLTNSYSSIYAGILSTGQQNQFAPASTIVQGTLTPDITYTDNFLKDVLNGLSDTSGSLFYVDQYYYIWYVPPYWIAAAVSLSDNPDFVTTFPYHDFNVEYDGSTMGNRIKVEGNKQNATAVDDTFSGDGVTTTFDLTLPPYTVQSVTIGGVKQTTGVYGVDTFSTSRLGGYKALVNKQQQYILFKTAPVSGSNNIVVEYTYEDAVIAQVLSPDSYAKYGRWFDRKVSDSNLTSTTAAKNRGLAELTKYAFSRTIPTFSTYDLFIPVGATVLLTCEGEGWTSQPFTVQTFETVPQGAGVYKYNYTAGSYNPTLIDHIRNLNKSLNRSTTTANVQVIVTIDAALFDTLSYSDATSATVQQTNPYNNYRAAVLADGPDVYYRLDESSGTTATDSSGNAYNGTYASSGVTYSEPGALVGNTDTAVLLDGVAGDIACPSGVNPATWAHITVEAWVNLSNKSFLTTPTIAANAIPLSSNTGFSLWFDAEATGVHFMVGNGTTYADAHYSPFFQPGVWYHLVGVWDGSTVRLYVNGVQKATASLSGSIASAASAPIIGHNPAGSSDYLPATIGQAAIYNAALSAIRVATHYTYGLGAMIYTYDVYKNTVLADKPQAYYRFDEASGTTANDQSGNGYNGTYAASGVTLAQPGALAGDTDTAALFDGVAGEMTCPSGLNPSAYTALTVEIWINFSSIPSSAIRIVDNHAPSTSKGFALYFTANAATLDFSVGNSTTFGLATYTGTFVVGTWYHIVGVWNGSTITIYLNGQSVATASLSGGSLGSVPTAIAFGYNIVSGGGYFPGDFDEGAIYNAALSAARVLAHYNKGLYAPPKYGLASYS